MLSVGFIDLWGEASNSKFFSIAQIVPGCCRPYIAWGRFFCRKPSFIYIKYKKRTVSFQEITLTQESGAIKGTGIILSKSSSEAAAASRSRSAVSLKWGKIPQMGTLVKD